MLGKVLAVLIILAFVFLAFKYDLPTKVLQGISVSKQVIYTHTYSTTTSSVSHEVNITLNISYSNGGVFVYPINFTHPANVTIIAKAQSPFAVTIVYNSTTVFSTFTSSFEKRFYNLVGSLRVEFSNFSSVELELSYVYN
jgi:hypothetical protein